jgi:hypothetical protein
MIKYTEERNGCVPAQHHMKRPHFFYQTEGRNLGVVAQQIQGNTVSGCTTHFHPEYIWITRTSRLAKTAAL